VALIGVHYCEEMQSKNPIVLSDVLELKEFDDFGTILDTSSTVPVVITSLIFPTSAGIGKDHPRSGGRDRCFIQLKDVYSMTYRTAQ